MSSKQLLALEKEERGLKVELAKTREEIRREKLSIAKESWGAEVGVVVVHQGKDHRVLEVDVKFSPRNRPWVVAAPQRKDGSFGTARRHLFSNWRLKSDTP